MEQVALVILGIAAVATLAFAGAAFKLRRHNKQRRKHIKSNKVSH